MNIPSKYPRTLYWPDSPSIASNDKTIKNVYDFIDVHVAILEKLDGSNCVLRNGEVFNRGGNPPSNADWNAMVKKHHAWKTKQLAKNLSFYGENLYGVHAIEYDAMPEEDTFRLFAIKDEETNTFLSWRKVEEFADLLDIKTVPVLFRGSMSSIDEINDMLETLMKQGSSLGKEIEGLVVRDMSEIKSRNFSRAVMKYVREGHVQADARHWRHNWKPCKIVEMAD